MNKYICVWELIFRLFRDMNLGRLCSNSLIASATKTSRNLTTAPRGFKIACKHVYFSPTARRVTSSPGVPPPPCKQALIHEKREVKRKHFKVFLNLVWCFNIILKFSSEYEKPDCIVYPMAMFPYFGNTLLSRWGGGRITVL